MTVHLQERLQTFEQRNRSLTDDTIVQKIQIAQLENDLIKTRNEKTQLELFYQTKIKVRTNTVRSLIEYST
jgi:hypothetical protein